MSNRIVFYSVVAPSGIKYRGLFFAPHYHYLNRMMSFRGLDIRWSLFFPLWLSKLIITIIKIAPITKLKTQHIQTVFSQIHNALKAGKRMHEQTLSLIFNSSKLMLKYELICIHQDLLNGKPFAESLSRFLGQEYSVLGALLVEAEKKDAFEPAVNEVSIAITQLAEQRMGFLNLIVSVFTTSVISVYFAHLLASLYMQPRIMIIKLSGGQVPFFIQFFHDMFVAKSTLIFFSKVLVYMFIFLTMYSFIRATKHYPKFMYRIELYLPVIGTFQKSLNALLLIRTLGIGFKSNIRMVNVLTEASIRTKHKVIRERISNALSFIKKGEPPVISIMKSKLLPFQYRYLFTQLIREADSVSSIDNILRLGSAELKKFYTFIQESARFFLIGMVVSFNVTSLWAYLYTAIEYNKYTI